ncbi:MAG: class I SAM-dependent methyltransferase [SAR202 cluster bacterium]|nr:class I SAM-dependent methyltransferase [SAR202 cluster bacterium]
MALNYDVWANLYDTIYGDVVDDIPYYVNQIKESDDKVLELGCGTGRVSIPIAENTSNLTALDLSSQMIAVLNKKAVKKGLILDCVIGDMRSFDIQSKFDLIIIPFRGFQSLLSVSDQEQCLAAIHRHLKHDGKVIIDMFYPDLEMFDQDKRIYYVAKEIYDASSKTLTLVKHRSNFDMHSQVIQTTLIVEISIAGNVTETRYTDFSLRYIHPKEAEYLFLNNGFATKNLVTNFTNLEEENEISEMVFELEKIA